MSLHQDNLTLKNMQQSSLQRAQDTNKSVVVLTDCQTESCMCKWWWKWLVATASVSSSVMLWWWVMVASSCAWELCAPELFQHGFRGLMISDILFYVENIPFSTWWTSNHFACNGITIAAAFLPSRGSVELDLSPWDSPKRLCNLGRVSGDRDWGHTSGQRYLTFAWFKVNFDPLSPTGRNTKWVFWRAVESIISESCHVFYVLQFWNESYESHFNHEISIVCITLIKFFILDLLYYFF